MLNELIIFEKSIIRNFLLYINQLDVLNEEILKIENLYKNISEDEFNKFFSKINNKNIIKNDKISKNLSLIISKHLILSLSGFKKDDICDQYFDSEWRLLRNVVNETVDLTKKTVIYLIASEQLDPKLFNSKVDKNIYKIVLYTIENLIIEKTIDEKRKLINTKTMRFLKREKKYIYDTEKNFHKSPSKIFIVHDVPYSINISYYTVTEIYKKNTFNPFSKSPTLSQLNFIVTLQNLKLFPNINLIQTVSNDIVNSTNKNKEWIKNNWWKIDELEKLKLFPESFKKKDIENLNENQLKRFNVKRNIQKKISLFLSYKDIIDFESDYHDLKHGFYLSFYTDFRWRIYPKGRNSPTNNKIIRHCINYGEYKTSELNLIEYEVEKSKCWGIISKYKEWLLKNLNLNKSYKNYEIAGLFWCLIELGKLNKESMQINGKIKTIEFLEKGLKLFESNNSFKDEKKLIYEEMKETIENIINNKQWKKTIIFKDATASVIQHLLKILGAKDEISTKYCNFSDNEAWWDPYFFVLSEYIKKYPNHELRKFMIREIWKPLILTFHYSVTLHTGIKYTMDSLKANEEFKKLNDTQKKKIEENMIIEIKKFFKFLNDFFNQNIFFGQNSNSLVNCWKEEESFIKTYDNASIYLNYYTTKEKRINTLNDNKERKTFTFQTIENEYDERQTLRALRANIVHAADAQYARLLIKKYKILAIHDSFGIDIFRICQFMDDANLLLKIELAKTSFATKPVIIPSNLYSIYALL